MRNFSSILLIVAVLMSFSSVFVVKEGQRAIVLLFSKVQKDSEDNAVVYGPGLHFKVPFFSQVKQLDARIQTLDGAPDRFVTSEKKDLIVDSFVKWRVNDFSAYYLRARGDKQYAETLLKQKVNNGLRTNFGNRTIKEIVSGERSELMAEALVQASESATELGIEVLDVRVKQINLPNEVSESIFRRMRAERTAVAKEHRSEGQEKAETIRAEVDRRVTVMLADAERNARSVRGEGDATAAKIYADAYNKDAEFFGFVRSLEAYKKTFNNKGDVMVLSPDSEFFDYMKDAKGAK
ncbi:MULTISPECIES: protease modulator HflC [Pseudoalteromonas]|uniref:Protein HflC n=1 Tax=Pseudoalteromonas phenolica TaxID=161398 RepID=A0A0S2K5G9_9GAMM|nr:protease modulator HflC [Pseudoalteromonas phenolica]ALO43311.1 Protein HflC [Pseudoalteromonas phenolica]MBE0355531.1 membrane protease subunit HflC [Pseudoalteromonas phenolica O-BC30]RXE95089.1 protease modulator HflC [Pseudoalteromonas phenolica O-BC30]TMN88272.1 protease modulator HflC [Pseudoalteromonas phenolica]TMO55008.1 protease modulator HflC [Pseudoalteromonas phenolica]|tara:strand:+ start:1626 stop:2507 length:882 start_codon:yes stop_codon:yes gene_type:complete